MTRGPGWSDTSSYDGGPDTRPRCYWCDDESTVNVHKIDPEDAEILPMCAMHATSESHRCEICDRHVYWEHVNACGDPVCYACDPPIYGPGSVVEWVAKESEAA